MLRKRPPPMIGKLSELLVSGGHAVEAMGSPRSPLPTKRGGGIKSYDLGGVGLKIVVALNDDKGDVILPKKHAFCTSKLNHRSAVKNPIGFQRNDLQSSLEEEEYTYVTYHVPNKTFTKVYYDDGGYNNVGILTRPKLVSPILIEHQEPSFPTSNFLSSCHLCGKKLHGKDIYMYRGEKAFCGTECRSSQIMMDERKEAASRSGKSSSSYNTITTTRGDQIFSTGILAI